MGGGHQNAVKMRCSFHGGSVAAWWQFRAGHQNDVKMLCSVHGGSVAVAWRFGGGCMAVWWRSPECRKNAVF